MAIEAAKTWHSDIGRGSFAFRNAATFDAHRGRRAKREAIDFDRLGRAHGLAVAAANARLPGDLQAALADRDRRRWTCGCAQIAGLAGPLERETRSRRNMHGRAEAISVAHALTVVSASQVRHLIASGR
jgi:hypothetical protein